MPSGVNAPSGTADSVSSSAAGLSEEASVSAWEVEGVWAAWLLSELLELLDALFATMSLTLERRKETALLRGSNLSYNEGVIGLTGHCLSFHARTGKL